MCQFSAYFLHLICIVKLYGLFDTLQYMYLEGVLTILAVSGHELGKTLRLFEILLCNFCLLQRIIDEMQGRKEVGNVLVCCSLENVNRLVLQLEMAEALL